MEFKLSTFLHLQYQVKMISTSTKGLALLVLLLTMLSIAKGENWQGSGNVTAEHLDFFWKYINANLSTAISNGQQGPFCTNFSNALNLKWDPAWNVAVTMGNNLMDSVLYGYAYNDHWYWYNGYPFKTYYYFAIIIWKDYNCDGWKTIDGFNVRSGFTSNQQTQIDAAVREQSGKSSSNIWNVARDFMTSLTSKSQFSGTDRAYTVVVNSHADGIWARICVVGSNHYYVSADSGSGAIGSTPSRWGNLLVFQTR